MTIIVRGEPTVTDHTIDSALLLVQRANSGDLSLEPAEAFVLACIDGHNSQAEIAVTTGLSPEQVARIATSLLRRGAIEVLEPQSGSVPGAARPSAQSGAYAVLMDAEKSLDLSAEQQQRLLDLDRRLGSNDHYQLLGIEPAADPKSIRSVYYDLVRAFHPDRFFGKELGSFEDKLLRVFAKITEAYEVLCRADSRAEYDRYLAAKLRTSDFERDFFDAGRRSREVESALLRIERAATDDAQPRSDALHSSLPPESRAPSSSLPPNTASPSPSLPPTSSSLPLESRAPSSSLPPSSASPSSSLPPNTASPSSSLPPNTASPSSLPPESLSPSSRAVRRPSGSFVADPEARRRALARKLGHSSTPPGRSPSSPSIPASGRAADDLKQRYEQRLAQARDEQRDHYLTLAKEAAARKDLVAAANALRVACSISPNNLELASELADMEHRAAAELWEAYSERAKYAAFEGRAAEAAESYERAAIGHPSAALFERAAFHTLEAEGDLKHAAQLAKQAISLAPNNAKCRLTLAQIYVAAKLRESALAELERARTLEPDSPTIKDWISRVKRGDV